MTITPREIAEKLADEIMDRGEFVGPYAFIAPLIAAALEEREREGYAREISDAANLLKLSAEHHAEVDKHPAWDRTRPDYEKCEEHDSYHSYPGYASHVVAQMEKVISALAQKDVKP